MADAPRSVVDVLLPGLLPPPGAHGVPVPRTPALEILLARGDRQTVPETDAVDWLMHRFGVPPGADWPAGALSLLGDAGQPGDACWLRVDPVHLRVSRDQLILADHRLFSISQIEAANLSDALNRHFSGEGFVFYPLRPERWYLRVPALPAITTTPLAAAMGRHIDPLLPKGPDALAWHRIFNELQMLLHTLPVNEEREARGELPVNSVWLWGAGTLPTGLERPYSALIAGDPLARGLALAAGCAALEPSTDVRRWLGDQSRGDLLVYEHALDAARAYASDAAWSTALERLERDILAPLLDALKSGQINGLRIVTFTASGGVRFEATRASLWRLWRGARPLSSFA